jgi:putative Ca2+/H+ antiporter (TMEM165/GDT1 family)
VGGRACGAALPTRPLNLAAGLAFLAFAAWTLRGDSLTEGEAERARRSTGGAVLAASIAFFLAELGDKTMLATITLATREGALVTWAGSTLGMVAADAIAILIGQQLGRRLPDRTIRIAAATSFVIFAALLIVEAART